ncbi:MAG: hypothetical protein KJ063_01890 [Anaerolineae bacterium]|nr:hypothetical protein [Anaerolineae bacterium]
MRGIVDRKGETFAYEQYGIIYTLDDEPTGRIEGEFVVDLAGNRVWRLVGDGLYTLVEMEPVGYLGAESGLRFED